MKVLVPAILMMLSVTCLSFRHFALSAARSVTASQSVRYRHTAFPASSHGSSSSLSMVTQDRPSKEEIDETFKLREVFTPKGVNNLTILWTVIGDIILFNFGFLSAVIFNVDMFNFVTSFVNKEVWSFTLQCGITTSLVGLIFDEIPWKPLRDIKEDTRFYALRLLGRNTSPLKAFATTVFMSSLAGICEELFFRGFLLQFFFLVLNAPAAIALLASSLAFGLSHNPRWGSSAAVETFLGLLFGISYIGSGFNIAVPILFHTLYDIGTLYTVWYTASRDLRYRLKRATESELINLNLDDASKFNALIRVTFDLLDTNGDELIDEVELDRGLKFFGISNPHPFDQASKSNVLLVNNKELSLTEKTTVHDIFNSLDKNSDGFLAFEEFRVLLSGGLFNWPQDREVKYNYEETL